LNPYLELTLAAIVVCAAFPAIAQTVPAATDPQHPLAVGAGVSGFEPDRGAGRIYGGTLWIDYSPNWVPSLLRGIGIEVEGRDLSLDRSSSQAPNLREDVAEGGLIYSWRRFRSFRPYAKGAMGYGNADYEGANLVRDNAARTVTALGGGVEVRATQRIWVRADYEYQFWPDFYPHPGNTPGGVLNPQGFTVGALYHFSRPHF
jgi:opacity protein-like surface antigen